MTQIRLTHEEEVALSRRIRAGLASADPATVADGRAAEAVFCGRTQWLVEGIAKRWAPRFKICIDEAISIINVSLVEMVRKFDPERGLRFITFANARLNGAILDGAPTENMVIHVPSSTMKPLSRVRREKEAITPGMTRRGVGTNMAAKLAAGDRALRVSTLNCRFHGGKWEEQGVGKAYVKYSAALTSRNPHDVEHPLAFEIERAIVGLTGQERFAVTRYFGLDGEAPQTLKQIGRALGLSESRLSQMMVAAREWMRTILSDHAA